MSASDFSQFTIGHYRVGKAIGQGTFGKVRLGVHIPTGEKVAVKTLQKEKITQKADIERVTRQICILKVLRHPNIIQLYEIIETKTDIHLIMEYAAGGELFDYIVKRKRLDQKEAIFFMQQLLAGVDYMHKNGVVHRDLKPENLLLDHNKTLKIVDFGLSNQYKPGERLKTACGSPCYAAPEMIAGKKYECLNVDVWSCGIILYAMLCGHLPFEDPNTSKLYKKIMSGDYQQPKVLTADSKAMLKSLLNVDPEARFKVSQIKDSKWYNLTGRSYLEAGLLVGKDLIEANERLVLLMAKEGMDPVQIKNYVANNRHNQVTSYYYLLKKKMDQSQKGRDEGMQSGESRDESPLIFRPEGKKQLLVGQKKVNGKDVGREGSNNDSFNVNNIISSLTQANRNKVSVKQSKVAKKDNLDKMQQFKIFPKQKAGSIYEPHPTSSVNNRSALTSRSQIDEKFNFNINKSSLATNDEVKVPTVESDAGEGEDNLQRKRLDISDQLNQISAKIDKEVVALRKQNNTGVATTPVSLAMLKKNDLVGYSTRVVRMKTQQPTPNFSSVNGVINLEKDSMGLPKDGADESIQQSATLSDFKQSALPKTHAGPFNSRCLFFESAQNLLLRITECLSNGMSMKYQQIHPYILRLSGYDQISIESLPGVSGYHLVKFSANSPLNEAIIEHLSK